MSRSFATGFSRRWRSGLGHYILVSVLLGILLFVLLWFLLTRVSWNPLSLSLHTGSETVADPEPALTFDLRFPAEMLRGPEGAAPTDASSIALPPKSPSMQARPSTQNARGTDPTELRRIMDLGVSQFATARDDAGKSKGASLVQLTALLGYPPARELIIRNYPRSPAVRTSVPMQDVVRFAVNLLAQGAPAPPSSDAAEMTIALGNYFSQRGDVLKFSSHVVESISDDPQLQTSDQITRVLSVLPRIPGFCTGIKRAISEDQRIDQDECSNALDDELLRYARSKDGMGIDAAGRARAMQLLETVRGAHK
jgi:hypothetical protein